MPHRQLRIVALGTSDIESQARPSSLRLPAHPLEDFRAHGFRQCHWIFDLALETVSHIGREFETLFRLPPDVMESSPTGFIARVHPEDRDSFLEHMQKHIESGVDITLRLFDGPELKWIWLRSFPLENDDFFSGARMLFVAEDVTSSKTRARASGD